MLNNEKANCPFEDEIVSYIYDEMVGSSRLNFETHLSDCTVCTDEFAAISDARFSVFEWQKEAFRHLPTPDIVIPYEPTRKVEENVSVGFFEGLRGWLKPMQVVFAASLIVLVGIGFLMLRSNIPSDQPVASKNVVQPVEPSTAPAIQKPEPVIQAPEIATATTIKTESKDIRPVKAVVRRQVVNARLETANNTVVRKPSVVAATAPVLSTAFEADDDNSLRLADLTADLDS